MSEIPAKIAMNNQSMAMLQNPAFGTLGITAPVGQWRPARSSLQGKGWCGTVTAIKNTVDELAFTGRDIRIWVGNGWFVRPFHIEGERSVVVAVKKWIEEKGR